MNIEQAVAAAATPGPGVRRAYRRAVAEGIHNTGCTLDRESACGTLRLLTLSSCGCRTSRSTRTCGTSSATSTPRPVRREAVVRPVRSPRVLRLAQRALEAHGRCVHHESPRGSIGRCSAPRALTDAALDADARVPIVTERARRAALALARASAATANDPMRVPEQLATGLGELRAVYLIATEAAAA